MWQPKSLVWQSRSWLLGCTMALCLIFVLVTKEVSFKLQTIVGFGMFLYFQFIDQQSSRGVSYRFLWPTIFFLALTLWFRIHTGYYLFFICLLLTFIESTHQQLGKLSIVQLLLSSSAFQYLAEVYTFPIRLKISATVGFVLKKIVNDVQIFGNEIVLNGQSFSVDQACVGLDMLTYSMFFTVFMIATKQRETSILKIILLLAIGFVLNLISNFFRIFVLLITQIGPENPIHYAIGMLCLLVYVCVPMYAIVERTLGHQPVIKYDKKKVVLWHNELIGRFLIAVCLLLVPYVFARPNGRKEHLETVQQHKTPKALVYIKPLASFATVEHNPAICWRGSGYVFTKIEEKKVGKLVVYQGVLLKNKQQLHTAWWFSDGQIRTISQFEWRKEALFGSKPFRLINITTATLQDLESELPKHLAGL